RPPLPAVAAAAPQRGRPGGRPVGAHRGALPRRAPPDPGVAAAGLLPGRDRPAHRPAPRQRPPHPPPPGPAAGLHAAGRAEPLAMTAPASDRAGPAPLTPDAADALAGELAQEMIRAWRRGERPLPEDYLARHPELWEHPEAAADLIYEELSL